MDIKPASRLALQLVLFTSSLGCAAIAQANLLTNGSFEAGAFSANIPDAQLFGAGDNTISGWTTTGDQMAWIDTPNTYGLSAQDGDFFLDLTGGQTGGPFGGVSQTFASVAGHEYSVSFYIGSRTDLWGGPPVSINVAYDGGGSFDVSDNDVHNTSTWTLAEFTFIADAGSSTTLTFAGTAGANYIGLDNIVVTDVTAVPIPAAVWLFGSALGAFGLIRRRT